MNRTWKGTPAQKADQEYVFLPVWTPPPVRVRRIPGMMSAGKAHENPNGDEGEDRAPESGILTFRGGSQRAYTQAHVGASFRVIAGSILRRCKNTRTQDSGDDRKRPSSVIRTSETSHQSDRFGEKQKPTSTRDFSTKRENAETLDGIGAGYGIRTRDFQLGKLTLYR